MGKTALAAEIGDVLEEKGLATAVLDLDWLGWVSLPDQSRRPQDLILQNLAAIWPNFCAAGARYLILARLLEDEQQVADLRQTLPDVHITLVRVDAPSDVVEDRLCRRDTGAIVEQHLRQRDEFTKVVERLDVDFVVSNDRPIREVAIEVLDRLGWTD